jgi:hypothetical protein
MGRPLTDTNLWIQGFPRVSEHMDRPTWSTTHARKFNQTARGAPTGQPCNGRTFVRGRVQSTVFCRADCKVPLLLSGALEPLPTMCQTYSGVTNRKVHWATHQLHLRPIRHTHTNGHHTVHVHEEGGGRRGGEPGAVHGARPACTHRGWVHDLQTRDPRLAGLGRAWHHAGSLHPALVFIVFILPISHGIITTRPGH